MPTEEVIDDDDDVVTIQYISLLCLNSNVMVLCFQLSDGMELLLVSILGPILLCEWQLESWQEAIITTVSSTSLSMGFLVVHSNWP